MKPKVIAVVGPTASGKTKLAIDLAKQIDGEIISADSRYVYKGFDIASAKPTIEEREGIPHYLIDIVEPNPTTVDTLTRLDLPSGVDIEIKL